MTVIVDSFWQKQLTSALRRVRAARAEWEALRKLDAEDEEKVFQLRDVRLAYEREMCNFAHIAEVALEELV